MDHEQGETREDNDTPEDARRPGVRVVDTHEAMVRCEAAELLGLVVIDVEVDAVRQRGGDLGATGRHRLQLIRRHHSLPPLLRVNLTISLHNIIRILQSIYYRNTSQELAETI